MTKPRWASANLMRASNMDDLRVDRKRGECQRTGVDAAKVRSTRSRRPMPDGVNRLFLAPVTPLRQSHGPSSWLHTGRALHKSIWDVAKSRTGRSLDPGPLSPPFQALAIRNTRGECQVTRLQMKAKAGRRDEP